MSRKKQTEKYPTLAFRLKRDDWEKVVTEMSRFCERAKMDKAVSLQSFARAVLVSWTDAHKFRGEGDPLDDLEQAIQFELHARKSDRDDRVAAGYVLPGMNELSKQAARAFAFKKLVEDGFNDLLEQAGIDQWEQATKKHVAQFLYSFEGKPELKQVQPTVSIVLAALFIKQGLPYPFQEYHDQADVMIQDYVDNYAVKHDPKPGSQTTRPAPAVAMNRRKR